MGLVEMYRTTSERYLKLAKQAIGKNRRVERFDDNQDRTLKSTTRLLSDMQFVPIISMQVWRICLEEEDPDYKRSFE